MGAIVFMSAVALTVGIGSVILADWRDLVG